MLPAELMTLARLHRIRQQQLAQLVLAEVRRRWALLDGADLAGSWAPIAPGVLSLVTAGQLEATRGAQEYVGAAVTQVGAESDPAGTVNGRALAGQASDGRSLRTLLDQPLAEVQAFLGGGMPTADALGVGLRHLERIVATQVQDAARVSTGVAIVNDRAVRGWVRMTTPPSCARCVILAGKFYKTNRGFKRHPLCDCVHVPCAEVIEPQKPRDLFGAMSDPELAKAGWSKADVRAIRDGADLNQVTNARRSLSSTDVAGRRVPTTRDGATRHGFAGGRLGAPKGARAVRLTPEAIYDEAERSGWSRDETIAALKQHGYIL